MNRVLSPFKKIYLFYYTGFKSMGWLGKRLWILVLIKLFIMFVVLKVFFFKDFLNQKVENQGGTKQEHVLNALTK